MGPVPGVWVTLHRVGKDTAGPVDSVRSDAAGRYRLRYSTFGASDAVYFASSTWHGIAYFTAPLRAVDARGDDAEITVFDTTSRAFPLSVKGQHLIVSRPDSTDRRTVVEVFELSNDSLVALVSVDTTVLRPTWSVNIPATALDVRVNGEESSPNAFVASNGRASIYSPIAPGIKQVAFTYKLPNSSFPLALTSEAGAVVFEVLLEEPQGTVSGQGFTAVDPVSLEGRNFRRFLAQDVKPDTRIVIELPSTGTPGAISTSRRCWRRSISDAAGALALHATGGEQARRCAGSAHAASAGIRGAAGGSTGAGNLGARCHVRAPAESLESVQQAYTARRAELRAALAEALGRPVDDR